MLIIPFSLGWSQIGLKEGKVEEEKEELFYP